MTTSIDLDRLEGLARAATKGPWEVVEHGFGFGHYLICEDVPGKLRPICATEEGSPDCEANAAFIAALNPETVLALISAARGLGGGDHRPTKMLVDANWLRWKVETDPDLDTEAASPAQSFGEWVLVPRQPTDAMVDAGLLEGPEGLQSYYAMLAAAPPPPEPLEDVVESAAKAAYETYCAMSMGLMFAGWDKEPEESKNIARAQVRAVLRVLKSERKEV